MIVVPLCKYAVLVKLLNLGKLLEKVCNFVHVYVCSVCKCEKILGKKNRQKEEEKKEYFTMVYKDQDLTLTYKKHVFPKFFYGLKMIRYSNAKWRIFMYSIILIEKNIRIVFLQYNVPFHKFYLKVCTKLQSQKF